MVLGITAIEETLNDAEYGNDKNRMRSGSTKCTLGLIAKLPIISRELISWPRQKKRVQAWVFLLIAG